MNRVDFYNIQHIQTYLFIDIKDDISDKIRRKKKV